MATILDPKPTQESPLDELRQRLIIKNAVELPVVLTMRQLQEVLQISRPKAYELAHQQGFPAVRLGRVIRIPRDALLQWLEKGGA